MNVHQVTAMFNNMSVTESRSVDIMIHPVSDSDVARATIECLSNCGEYLDYHTQLVLKVSQLEISFTYIHACSKMFRDFYGLIQTFLTDFLMTHQGLENTCSDVCMYK